MRKFLSALLTVALIISIFPIVSTTVIASSGSYEYILAPFDDGTVEIVGINGNATSIDIEADIKKYGYTVTAIGDAAFSNTTIEKIVMPDTIDCVGREAFMNCTKLKSISLSPSIKSINEKAFDGCCVLESITIPEGVTSIDLQAFNKCSALKNVSIPKSVITIAAEAFKDCTALTDVYYSGSENEWNNINISSTANNWLTSATKHFSFCGIKQVALGGYHSAALTDNGDLFMWGDNSSGQLGNGTTINSSIPIKVLTGVESVELGSYHSAAIMKNGDLYMWGANDYGELGIGTSTDSTVPAKVMSNVASVVLPIEDQSWRVAAITRSNDLYMWGSNSSGQLGDGTTTDKSYPVKIMSDVKTVDFTYSSTAAITLDGDLYVWGSNGYYNLGVGSDTSKRVNPVKILSNIAKVDLSYKNGAAISNSGILYTWGDDHDGQVGSGNTDRIRPQGTPKAILTGVKAVDFADRGTSVIALSTDGTLYGWGCQGIFVNDYGIGNTIYTRPEEMTSDIKQAMLSASMMLQGYAIDNNDDLHYWKDDSTTSQKNITLKKQISNVKSFEYAVTSYSEHYAVLTKNNELFMWGDNSSGQIGNGTTSESEEITKVVLSDSNQGDEPSDDPVEDFTASLKYGADRFSFGKDIAGYVGETLDTLVVYATKEDNIASLDISSSNSSVVEIGTIKIGSGEYITGENEHKAIIPLKLKSEGTATITIVSPEGVSESVTVTVSKVPETKKSIAVFTTEKSLSINTGESMWLAFGLMNEDTGLVEEDWKRMAVTVSDPTIISLSDYEETEYGYSLEVIGKKEGSTNVTITDTETGINTIIVISVHDSFVQTYSYAIDNINTFYPNNGFENHIATNIYDINGMYVNNYNAIENTDGSYTVTFDVYNSKYYYGAIDIYDENGMWLGFEEIKKHSDIDSVWDTGVQTFYLISESLSSIATLGKESNLLTYQQASFSTKTKISISVPKNGYFTISNNIAESPGTYVVNSLEILFDAAFTVLEAATTGINKVSAFDDILKETKKTFAQRLIDARNEGLKNEVKRKAQKVMLNSMQSKIKNITKTCAKEGIIDQISVMSTASSELAGLLESSLFAEYEINWKSIFESTFGLGEAFFTKFSGPAGMALQGCFAITKGTNKLLMVSQLVWSSDNPYVSIYSDIEEGYINPHGVVVNTSGNIDSEAVLQVFKISNEDSVEVILNNNNPLEKYELYNICFVKNDQLVQPNGKVTVHIPIPEGMNGNTCKVYRQETDGSWTILDAHVDGNYLVFETEHFSLYSVTGDMETLNIHSLPNKIIYTNGDVLDTEGLVLDLNGELISEGFICDPTVLSGIGSKKITVQYGNASTDFNVEITEEVVLSSISVQSKPTKLTYYIGDTFNAAGLVVKLNYSDGTTETITSGFTTSGFSSTTAGTKNVTVSYEGFTDTFTVTVKTPSITLSSSNKNMSVGDSSAITATTTPSAQTVTWTSSNTSVATVSNGTITAKAAGSATITVKFTYNGNTYSKTCSVTVNPEPIVISSIEIITKPSKTTYCIGDTLNTSGLNLKLTYNDGSTKTVTSGFTTSGFDSTTAGTKNIIVNYQGFTDTFSVVIKSNEIHYIYTVNDLIAINDDLSGNYILMNDIDLSSIENWEPIGENIEYWANKIGTGFTETEKGNYFTGTLDGNGYTIKNLTINSQPEEYYNSTTGETVNAFGLFSHISGAEIKNLTFTDVNINIYVIDDTSGQSFTKKTIAAAISASAKNSTISNCNILSGTFNLENGTYSGGAVAIDLGDCTYNAIQNNISHLGGGIVGACDHIGTIIKNCVNKGDYAGITGGGCPTILNCYNFGITSTGGIIGRAYSYTGNGLHIENCANFGDVICTANDPCVFVGGIIGELDIGRGMLTLRNCVNYGNLYVSPIDKEGGYISAVGGIAGSIDVNDSSINHDITNCVNYGKINIDLSECISDKSINVGGICGDHYGLSINVKQIFNYGDIEVLGSNSNWFRISGLLGYGSVKSLSNSANYGNIIANNSNHDHLFFSGIADIEYEEFKNISNTGNIEVSGQIEHLLCGGISRSIDSSLNIKNIYNIGNINVVDKSFSVDDNISLGGIMSVLLPYSSGSIITNSYNIGEINLLRDDYAVGSINIGSVYGVNPESTQIALSNYYTTQNSIDKRYGSGDLEVLDSITVLDDFSKESTFKGFDFSETWTLENGQYPTLINARFEDKTTPTILTNITNNISSSQKITLQAFDNIGIKGYYWGTNSAPTNYTSVTTNKLILEKTVSNPGTYYLIAKDAEDNIKTASVTFYKTTLNVNGGSVTPSILLTKSGNSITLPTPTRSGYTFLGWSTNSTATSPTYQPGGSFTSNANTTLYAIWKANTYTVTYDANGGTGAPSSQTKNHGVNLTLSSTRPIRTGYTFLGWATSSTATSADYQPGASFTTNANVVLYAVWEKEATLSSISVQTNPTKLTYYIGDTFNSSGLVVKLNYSNGTSSTITSGFTISGFNSTSAGTKTVTVSYEGFTDTFTVTVKMPSLALSKNNVSLKNGDTVTLSAVTDPNNEDVNWTSSDTSIATVSNGVIMAKKAGTTTITAKFTYNGIEYFDVCTVTCIVPVGLEIDKLPDKTVFYVGDGFDRCGLKTKMLYSDGSYESDWGVTSTSLDQVGVFLSEGTRTVIVYNGSYSTSYTIEVKPLLVKLLTNELSLNVGNTHQIEFETSPSDMSQLVSAKWTSSNRNVATVDENGMVKAVGVGTAEITLKIVNGACSTTSNTCTITVDNPIESISIKSPPTKTEYYIGDLLDVSGLNLLVVYEDGSTETITSGFTTSGFNSTTAGTKTVTVAYNGLTTTFTVTVIHTHNYTSSVTKKPSCTSTGVRTYTCSSCGDNYTESISATGHSWKNESCEEPKTCTKCGITSGDALGHDYNARTTKNPTCTENGIKTYTCIECGDVYTKNIPALGHDYDSGVVTNKATCKATGVKTYTCEDCGATMTSTIAKLTTHTYSNNCDKSCNVCGKTRTVGAHKYSNSCDTTCNYCNAKRTIKHTYSNSCDTSCNVCKATRTITHTYKTTTTKATLSKNGSIVKKCTVCGKVASNTTIKYAKTFKLSAMSYTYNGKVKTPTVTVKDSSGKTLKKDTDYTVSYASGRKNAGTYKVIVKMIGKYSGTKTLTFKINPAKISSYKLSATAYTYDGKVKTPNVTVKNASGTKLTKNTHYTVTYASGRKNVGTYKITIKGKGNYTGTKTLTFKINPPKTTVSKLTAGKKSIAVAITKKSTQVTGYQLQYSTSKDFTKATTKSISSYNTTKYNIKSLSANKTYYVRVRTYKKVGNTTYYSGWSAYKYVKTK